MFQTIAEITGAGPDRPRGGSRRTGEPVRRHSRAVGREGVLALCQPPGGPPDRSSRQALRTGRPAIRTA
jgi:hypothetical protein